ncbi:hypothetical protein Tco_1505823 [Tanacetum coccineum]
MFRNLDQLRLQLEKENLFEVNPRTCLDALRTQFKEFFASKRVNSLEHLNQCWQKDFKEYMFCELDTYRRDLLELDTLEAVIHRAVITYGKLQLQSQDVQINPVQAVDDSLIVSKSSWIESENNNALNTSVNETQLQQHEITPHYLPKVREYVLAKPHHVISPDSFRNSQEEPYGSNDMAHNHYLEEARKKTQERNRNSKPSVMHTTSLQNTTNGSKPNPRSNNQISRSLPVSKSSCGMSNGMSLTRNINKPVEPKSHTQKPGRQIAKGQRFSPKKSSAVHEKPNTPKSCLSEPPNGSNDYITNPYECDQTLNVSAGTTNLSAGLALQRHDGVAVTLLGPVPLKKRKIQSMVDVPIHQEDLVVQRTPLIDPVISMESDGSSCWTETCQFTTPCSHFIFLIKAIMIAERPTTQLSFWLEKEKEKLGLPLSSLSMKTFRKFHKITDAKEMWEAIKSRFGGNDESKKMQKYILKQQFESFSVSSSEGLHKGYDMFQSLLSQLEIHDAGVSTEDANQKFLRVFESDVKGPLLSIYSTQNVAFVSSESTSNTNNVSTAYGVSTSSGHNSQKEGSSSYTDKLKYSFFANQSSGPQLDHEDLEQIDEFDLV